MKQSISEVAKFAPKLFAAEKPTFLSVEITWFECHMPEKCSLSCLKLSMFSLPSFTKRAQHFLLPKDFSKFAI